MPDYRSWMSETAFGKNTRQNMRNMNNFTFSAGGRESIAIPRTGYLARIHNHLAGTITVTLGGGTAAIDTLGPWNTFNRVRLQANSGTDVFNTSGWGAYLANIGFGPGKNNQPDGSGLQADITGVSTSVYSVPVTTNPWEFGFTVPVAVNDMSELGLIMLQNEVTSVTQALEYASVMYSLTGAQAPFLVTGAAVATLVATVTPMVETFMVPVDPAARPDISWIHQILEITQPIAAVGDNTVNLVRENLYLGILNYMIINNVRDGANLDRLRLVLNQSDTPYDYFRKNLLQLHRYRYGRDLPLGVAFIDLFDQGIPGLGDERDIINGKATSELQQIFTVNSGATLGTNSRWNTITRQLVKLTTPATIGG
jgi:hypothetical protein